MPLQVKKVQLKVKDGNQYVDGDMLFNVDAEAWARGKRNGQTVPSTDPTYHNNAEYFAQQAAASAASADQIVFTGNLAPSYSSSTAYQIGDYVMQNDTLYECITTIPSPGEAFNANHWREVMVSDIKEQVDNIIVVNEQAQPETKVQIETTDEDVDIALMSDLTTAVSSEQARATAAENLKVNRPLVNGQPSNGVDGQVLRTRGDGTTVWQAVGTPGQAQTQAAVDAWMDENAWEYVIPDNSIDIDKLQIGTLGYVTPEMFGAKGDGETDDTNAIQLAINSGLPIIGFGKTYKITALQVSDTIIYDCNFEIDSSNHGGRAIRIATGKSLHLENCSFTSQNNIEIDTDYAHGYTSNIIFIYASYGANEIIINNCKFINGYNDFNIQGTQDYTTSKVYINNCESKGAYTSTAISYCSDIKIENSKYDQNEGALSLAHIIYVSSGDSNVLKVDHCYFNAHSVGVIHCFHGTNYKSYITNSEIVTDTDNAFMSAGQNDIMVVSNCKITGNKIVPLIYDCQYKFINCIIKSRLAVIGGNSGPGSVEFINCDIDCLQLAASIGISCKYCNIHINSTASALFSGTNLLIYMCTFKYTCTNDNPIRIQGNSKILKCIFENTETTSYAWYATGDNNFIKDNIFINIPNRVAGLSTNDNLFI